MTGFDRFVEILQEVESTVHHLFGGLTRNLG